MWYIDSDSAATTDTHGSTSDTYGCWNIASQRGSWQLRTTRVRHPTDGRHDDGDTECDDTWHHELTIMQSDNDQWLPTRLTSYALTDPTIDYGTCFGYAAYGYYRCAWTPLSSRLPRLSCLPITCAPRLRPLFVCRLHVFTVHVALRSTNAPTNYESPRFPTSCPPFECNVLRATTLYYSLHKEIVFEFVNVVVEQADILGKAGVLIHAELE